MYFLSIWTFIVAISISIVAAYYSIVGLTAIFAAAIIPVIIMGTVLEIGKITTAIWLHLNWKNANNLIKIYLVSSTLVLMLITSMGIFGFLSRAHIEQQSASQEQFAKISQIEQQINYNENEIKLKTTEIKDLSSNKNEIINEIQSQIDIEQDRIDRVLERIKPEIQEQENIISEEIQKKENSIVPLRESISDYENRIEVLQTDKKSIQTENYSSSILQQIRNTNETISTIEQEITLLETLKSGDNSSIRRLQNIIGVNADGQFGPNTERVLETYISNITNQKNDLSNMVISLTSQMEENRAEYISNKNSKIETIDIEISKLQNDISALRDNINEVLSAPSDIIENARNRIKEIRNTANEQVDNSNILIQTLRQELKTIDDSNDKLEIQSLETDIKNARNENLDLTSEKYVIESEIRKLEAEVGPIKYIAELIYEEADNKETLEKAVRIVILLLVFVFDPLAIVLILAAISTFELNRNKKNEVTLNKMEDTDNIIINTDEIDIENIDIKFDDHLEEQLEMNFDISSNEQPEMNMDLGSSDVEIKINEPILSNNNSITNIKIK